MGQEFFVKSDTLESKVRQLLPSQGGKGAGFDLSASTQIVPIVDLTESAEGSEVRQDLQTALSFKNTTVHDVANTTTTIISNTGYFRVFGVANLFGAGGIIFTITDGATNKVLTKYVSSTSQFSCTNYDFVIFTSAGDSVTLQSTTASARASGAVRQIADIDGNLINPT